MTPVGTRVIPAIDARPRLAYLDNLKTVLIAGIIAAHAVQGYAAFGSWTYQDVREVSISEPATIVLAVLLSFGSLFLMACSSWWPERCRPTP